MSDSESTQALAGQVTALTQRVGELERAVTELGGEIRREAAAPSRPTAAPLPPPPAVRRPTAEPAPRRVPPRRDPIDWSAAAERLFTARTLAWAGGVATVLGIVLLFVMASSRGWITPGMRVGVGVLASVALLGFSFELDRRKVRADAILSAGGAGIAGLYASLWASIAVYHLIGQPLGLLLAGGIAALAVALAVRIDQQPLAIFGVVAAMLAPTLVSQGVTADGALFSFVIACAGLPLYLRYRWEWLVLSVWLAAVATILPLYASTDPGASAAVLAGACFWSLFTAESVVFELRPARRARISERGWLLLGSTVPLAFATAFLYAGHRFVHGHRLAGFTMLGVALLYSVLAVTPALARRRHPDLEDAFAGFALAALATATGLLFGGPGMVCAWAAESVVMVALAERLLRRSGTRRVRLIVSSGAYLGLAVAKTAGLTLSATGHLDRIGHGSAEGAIALGAVTVAGIVYCYGVRFGRARELQLLWLVPALALGYLPMWSLGAEPAVCAYAGLAAALLMYRRSRWMVAWLDDRLAIVIASSYWAAGLAVSVTSSAPLQTIAHGHFGEHDGVVGLALLIASGCVGAWSVRRPASPYAEYAALVPAATFGYLACEATTQHRAMWAALAVTAAAACAGHAPTLRRRIGERPLLAIGAGYLTGALAGLISLDRADQAIVHHGRTSGWGTLALAVLAGLQLASAVLDPRLRGYAMWVPAALTCWLATLVLPGQYPLVAWALVSGGAALIVLHRPAVLEQRISRQPLLQLAAAGAAITAAIVLVVYETPHMLFTTNHAPARNLAAAVGSVVALALVMAAASAPVRGRKRWQIGGMPVASAAAAAMCAMALWTLAAAILGAFQLTAGTTAVGAVDDAFQQGHVMVSVSWVLTGLALVVASLRGDRRRLRVAGVALLFVALGKLFLYDLAFLTAMARAISFILTGSVLLVAALLLQRFAPQVKGAIADDDLSREATA